MLSPIRLSWTGALIGLLVGGVQAQSEPKPLPKPQLGNGMASRPLLMEPVVQQELSLNDKQRNRLTQIENATLQANQPNLAQTDEGEFDFNTMMGNVEVSARERNAAIAKVLTPAQKSRLTQIEWQREGWMALARPDMVKRVKLTQPQVKKIQSIFAKMKQAQLQSLSAPVDTATPAPDSKAMSNLNPANGFVDKTGAFTAENGPMSFGTEANRAQSQKSLEQFDQISLAAGKEVDTVLTAEQRADFEKLLGAPFNFGLLNGVDTAVDQTTKPATPAPTPAARKPASRKATRKP